MVSGIAGQEIERLRAALDACRQENARLREGSDPDLFDTRQAAQRLGVSLGRIHQLIRGGKFEGLSTRPHPGGKQYLIPREALATYAEARDQHMRGRRTLSP